MTKSFAGSILGMSFKASWELTIEIGLLNKMAITMGLDVVWCPKVEPVGGMEGGYLDL